MTGLSVEIRRKAYPPGPHGEETPVLAEVSLDVAAGAFVAILGPSGCGKTTLLRLVAGLDREFTGRIAWSGPTPAAGPKIGFVFQEPTLLPWRTVSENLRLVMTPAQIARDLDRRFLEAMGLGAHGDHYPRDLSLGMSRRVALARAFSVEPDLLLMDEPFVSLDERTAEELRGLLLETWRGKPTTVLFVTHDSAEAVRLAERVVVLAGVPARVVRDQPVELTATQRREPAPVEALRRRLKPGAA